MISLYSFLLLVETRLVVHGSFGGGSPRPFLASGVSLTYPAAPDIGGMLYGKYMRWMILFSIVLSQVGFVAAYTIFVVRTAVRRLYECAALTFAPSSRKTCKPSSWPSQTARPTSPSNISSWLSSSSSCVSRFVPVGARLPRADLLSHSLALALAMIRNIQKLSGTALVADAFILFGLVYIFSNEIKVLSDFGVADVALFNSKDFPLLIG